MLSDNKNIIFLLSLPRSGSTLLQRVLSQHDDIKTESEPWLMLHPLYALKEDGHTAEYNETWAYGALKNFLASMPDGEDVYYEGLRRMLVHLYDGMLRNTSEQYFLDKTPRYYEVIREIHKIFPSAKFVILIRNPIAVLNSRIELLGNNKLKGLQLYKRDLLAGPNKILDAIDFLGESCHVIRYENLVENPESEVNALCNYLGIDYKADLLDYNLGQNEWEYGDPEKVYANSKPSAAYKDVWIKNLEYPRLWKIYFEYFDLLGQGVFDDLGYDAMNIRQIFIDAKPQAFRTFMCQSLDSLLK